MKITLILILVALSILYFYRRNTSRTTSSNSKSIPAKAQIVKTKASNNAKPPFRCVIIVPGVFACEAAKNMSAKPILMNEAPVLPLGTCKAKKCVCKFTRHDDRRMNSRREATNAAGQITGNIENKRAKQDRRQSADKT